MAEHGLIVGKFYPPHRGHHYLIHTARAQVEHLTVLLCRHDSQQIPAELRAAWLREVHPNVEVRIIQDIGRDDDSQAWAEYTRQLLGQSPDIVFTSEDYGAQYAYFLGCRHVQVDKGRVHVPCSGTAIRSAPLAHWEFLEPCVRAYFVKRIALFGAESSGTTTLTQALAEYYDTAWAPEYGREYAAEKMRGSEPMEWRTEEFTHIALQQCALEESRARQAKCILFCDTPAFATSLWHERYLGCLSSEVEVIAAPCRYDLYFLTNVDIPFVQDGTRDGEHIRHHMHERFVAWLTERNLPFLMLSGSFELRLKLAAEHIDRLLKGAV